MSPYLAKRGKKYSYRRRVPLDLLYCHHTDQIRLSLKTNSKKIANKISALIDERLEKVFADIRILKLTHTEARNLVLEAIEYSGTHKNEPTLKEQFKEYESSKGMSWSTKGKQEFWKVYEMASAEGAIGNKIMRLIDRSLIIQFRDSLMLTGIAPRTANKYLQRLNSVFRYSVTTRIISANPCIEVKFHISKRAINERKYKPYCDSDIKYILEEMLRHDQENPRWRTYMYWLPLLGAFTGARVGDIADLTKGDFEKRGNVHCIVMENHKTGALPRYVPIHSKLIELGLIEWVNNLKPEEKLFNLTTHRKSGEGEVEYKWYMRELRKYIKDDRKVFHSWRSTLSSRLNNAGVVVTHRADILGHERGDCETDRTYTTDTEILVLKEAMEKLIYPVDWEKVKLSKTEIA